ncbi:hypothetical protein ACIP2X_07580 [Streptomyces sp. NPDC089424]|uniref:hypothetical protein n=1 Tax=Streptomyces sp. NPDC089424 TaxID=3365917 RepID=UPI0037F42F8A
MSVRPYPPRARTLRQIMRQHRNEIPPALMPVARSPQGPVGEYRLPTRADYPGGSSQGCRTVRFTAISTS